MKKAFENGSLKNLCTFFTFDPQIEELVFENAFLVFIHTFPISPVQMLMLLGSSFLKALCLRSFPYDSAFTGN